MLLSISAILFLQRVSGDQFCAIILKFDQWFRYHKISYLELLCPSFLFGRIQLCCINRGHYREFSFEIILYQLMSQGLSFTCTDATGCQTKTDHNKKHIISICQSL